MAEDKTFRYGLIVLGFFLIMVGMFIMSVDKPQVYITFCTIGVLLVCVGITWSICQCYPKITFTPVDMEAVPLSDKSSMFANVAKPEKQCYSAPYTSSKEAEQYEATLPTYEQIQIKVEELGESKLDQSVPPLPQHILKKLSQSKLQARVDIHRNSLGKEENAMVGAICQSAPLASLKEDTNVTTSEDGRSSSSSLHSSEDWLHKWPQKQGDTGHVGHDYDGIEMADAQMSEADYPDVQQGGCQVPNHEDGYTSKDQPGDASLIFRNTQGDDVDDLYYGMKDETDHIAKGYESDLEQ